MNLLWSCCYLIIELLFLFYPFSCSTWYIICITSIFHWKCVFKKKINTSETLIRKYMLWQCVEHHIRPYFGGPTIHSVVIGPMDGRTDSANLRTNKYGLWTDGQTPQTVLFVANFTMRPFSTMKIDILHNSYKNSGYHNPNSICMLFIFSSTLNHCHTCPRLFTSTYIQKWSSHWMLQYIHVKCVY